MAELFALSPCCHQKVVDLQGDGGSFLRIAILLAVHRLHTLRKVCEQCSRLTLPVGARYVELLRTDQTAVFLVSLPDPLPPRLPVDVG